MPLSNEMPGEIRPLVVWHNTLANCIKIDSLFNMTPVQIRFKQYDQALVNVPLGSPNTTFSNNALSLYGIGSTPTWPTLNNGVTTEERELLLLIDFNKTSCDNTNPAPKLKFPFWWRRNTSCLSQNSPLSTSTINLSTIITPAANIGFEVNNESSSTVIVNAPSSSFTIPLEVGYGGMKHSVNHGYIQADTSGNLQGVSLAIKPNSGTTYTPLNFGTSYDAGSLNFGQSKTLQLSVKLTDCVTKNITMRAG